MLCGEAGKWISVQGNIMTRFSLSKLRTTAALLFIASVPVTAQVTPAPAQAPAPVEAPAAVTPADKAKADAKNFRISLSNEILPFFRTCMRGKGGKDIELLVTSITLNIDQNKALASAIFNGQRGLNATNRDRAGLHRDCAIKAAKAASPYSNLPSEGYAVWRSWKMDFSTR
jgi:hypothetical protein